MMNAQVNGAALIAMLVAPAAPAPASAMRDPPCYYDVTILDLIPNCAFGTEPSSITPRAIADNGWVTGGHPQCNGTGFSWVALSTDGQEIESLIPAFDGVLRAGGLDVSSNGLIVGWMDTDGVGRRGFLYDHGMNQWLELQGLPNTTFSEALGLNESGIVVGRTGNQITGPSPLAVMWIDGTPVDLAAIFGTLKSAAFDINSTNVVTGWLGDSITTNARAYRWDGSKISVLPDLPNTRISVGNAINDTGAVVGYTGLEDAEFPFGRPRATLWEAGGAIDLGVLPGFERSWAYDVNRHNVVVGHCQGTAQSSNERRAFIWQEGVMTALNDLVDPTLGIDIREAHSINDEGQIAATAVSDDLIISFAVVLTPPNPADIDGDCTAGLSDLVILLTEWGLTSSPADLDENGVVDVLDLLFLLGHWG